MMRITLREIALVSSCVCVLASCSKDANSPLASERVLDSGSGVVSQALDVSEFPATRRVGIELTAIGPFLPDRPIQVVANLSGRLASTDVALQLLSIDEDTTGSAATLLLDSWNGPLARGLSQSRSAFVRFDAPGYYRITAIARAIPDPTSPRALGDTLVLDFSHETIWIRVSERDGRLTAGYDSTAIDSRSCRAVWVVRPFRFEVHSSKVAAAWGYCRSSRRGRRHQRNRGHRVLSI